MTIGARRTTETRLGIVIRANAISIIPIAVIGDHWGAITTKNK